MYLKNIQDFTKQYRAADGGQPAVYQIWWQINRIERSSAPISVKISEIQAKANGRYNCTRALNRPLVFACIASMLCIGIFHKRQSR